MDLTRPFQTVTPTLDGDVLAVLARAADVPFTPGQVQRVLGRHSEEGIRKVLRRLTAHGTVRSTRIGNAYTYRLAEEHLAYPHVLGLARLFDEFLERLEAALGKWAIQPVYGAVFGSAARGTMTVHSDIDLLLVRPDDAAEDIWDRQVSDLLTAVSGWTGNDVRDLQFTAAQIKQSGMDEPVLRDVLREGLTVAGSARDFGRLLRGRG